jgi:hypothetical protein
VSCLLHAHVEMRPLYTVTAPSFLVTTRGPGFTSTSSTSSTSLPNHTTERQLPMARDLAPDWILQETLAIQAQTAQWFKDKQAEHAGQKPLTLTVLGCGTG